MIKHVKLVSIQIFKLFMKKNLFDKLVLACKDEILNTTKTSIVDKKATYEKYNFLISLISLVIVCFLLLLVISFSCYHYYAKHQLKNKYLLLYQIKK